MYLRVNSPIEGSGSFGIDFIAIEFESGNGKGRSFPDISSYPDNLSFKVIRIGYEGCRSLPDNGYSRDCSCWRDFYPFAGFEYYAIFRGETSGWTENLFLSEFIVDIHGSICIFRAHLVDGCHVEDIFHRYFEMYRAHINGIFTIEYTGFFLREYDISRYGFNSEFRCYRYIGF